MAIDKVQQCTQQDESYPRAYLYKRIVGAKLFIDANYQEKIELTNIADEACFSKFHFIRLFKTAYGKTPHQYLMHRRLEKAKQLLRLNHPVSETCWLVGFDSLTSFTALFKKAAGKTPSAYQDYHRVKQDEMQAIPLRFIPNCFAEQKGWTKNSNFQEVL